MAPPFPNATTQEEMNPMKNAPLTSLLPLRVLAELIVALLTRPLLAPLAAISDPHLSINNATPSQATGALLAGMDFLPGLPSSTASRYPTGSRPRSFGRRDLAERLVLSYQACARSRWRLPPSGAG